MKISTKITHLVTLLTCFTLSLSLPLFGSSLPVTSSSPPIREHATRTGMTTDQSSTAFTPTRSSSTHGIHVETTTVTIPTIGDAKAQSAKRTDTSSTSVVTTHSVNTREPSVAGKTTVNTVTSTVTSRRTAASVLKAIHDPRCIVKARDFYRPHTTESDTTLDTEDPVEKRALCKFEYTANINRLRHPEVMPEVVCPSIRCGHCGGDGRCEPVYHNFKVLRRCDHLDDDNTYLYRYDYERLAVACVCATPALEAGKPVKPARSDSDDDGPAPVLD